MTLIIPAETPPEALDQPGPASGLEEPPATRDFSTAAKWQFALFGGGLLTAALAISLYSFTGPGGAETFGTLGLFGAAACVVGGFFGFLFGVPRSAVGVKKGEGADGQELISAQSVLRVRKHQFGTDLRLAHEDSCGRNAHPAGQHRTCCRRSFHGDVRGCRG